MAIKQFDILNFQAGWKSLLGTGLVALVAGGAGGYFAGFDSGKDYVPSPPEPRVYESSYAKDLPGSEEMASELADLQARMEDLREKAEEGRKTSVEIDLDAMASGDEIAQLQSRLDSMPAPGDLARTNDFLTDPRINEPQTPSGVSVQVLNSYQREAGISPQEVEELMQKGRD